MNEEERLATEDFQANISSIFRQLDQSGRRESEYSELSELLGSIPQAHIPIVADINGQDHAFYIGRTQLLSAVRFKLNNARVERHSAEVKIRAMRDALEGIISVEQKSL